MWISSTAASCNPRPGSRNWGQGVTLSLLRVATGALLGVLSGCANPGPPRPPSLNLPAPPKDLRAERIGNQVRLTWTTPTDTTDDLPAKLPMRAEVCRDVRPAPATACTVVLHLPVTPGPSAATDPLPPSLLHDPTQLLSYRVRILNDAGHAADPSSVAFAAAGAAPPPMEDLHAASSAAGVRIVWRPQTFPTTSISLQRTLAASSQPATRSSGSPTVVGKPSPGVASLQTVRLEGAPAGPDPGGLVDPSAQRDATYSYSARRSRSVVLDGKPLLLRSAESPPVTVTVRDTTPPAAPVNLAGVADGAAVDLSWEPNAESDFAGYWIERSPAADSSNSSAAAAGTWQHLNPSLLQAPAYRDQPVPAGSFFYRVRAVDTSGNPSPPTPAVLVTVHPSSMP